MGASTCSRRSMVLAAGTVGAGLAALALAGCERGGADGEVTANEDLMREHSLIRRALLVYCEASRRLRQQPDSVALPELLDAARLIREFGEDYHERALEEAHILPLVRTLRLPVARLPDVLQAQHVRGREITDYVLKEAAASLSAADAERLAATLDAFAAMFRAHAAREDTELFPAWRSALGEKNYEEMGDRFEEIEHRMLGRDGFESALRRTERIEFAFGIGDLAAATAPPPPNA